jgi:hypothetical protein
VATTASVRFNGKQVLVLDCSKQPGCTGDDPGTGKGVKSGTVNGEVKPTAASSTVRCEGKQVVRVNDANTMNGGNNPGIYVTTQQPSGGRAERREKDIHVPKFTMNNPAQAGGDKILTVIQLLAGGMGLARGGAKGIATTGAIAAEVEAQTAKALVKAEAAVDETAAANGVKSAAAVGDVGNAEKLAAAEIKPAEDGVKRIERLKSLREKYLGRTPGKKSRTGPRVKGELDGAPKNNSGATIGVGVDLGTKDSSFFDLLDSENQRLQLLTQPGLGALKEKISPYFGKQGGEACKFLREHPLELNKAEVVFLNSATHEDALDNAKNKYEYFARKAKKKGLLKSPLKFDDLTVWQQTAAVSNGYQYGNPKQAVFEAIAFDDPDLIPEKMREYDYLFDSMSESPTK